MLGATRSDGDVDLGRVRLGAARLAGGVRIGGVATLWPRTCVDLGDQGGPWNDHVLRRASQPATYVPGGRGAVVAARAFTLGR